MLSKVFIVEGMTCEHCEITIKKIVTEIIGVRRVDINLKSKEVQVHFDETQSTIENISSTIIESGFKIE